MKKSLQVLRLRLNHENATLEQRISDVFVLSGVFLSASAFISNIAIGMDLWLNLPSLIMCLVCIFIAFMVKGENTRYVNAILLYAAYIYFPYIYFITGGYNGTMPMYFIGVLVFMTLIFPERWRIVGIILTLFFYGGLFVFACRFPEFCIPHVDEVSRVTDFCVSLLFSGTVTSLATASIVKIYKREHNNVKELLIKLQGKNEELLNLSIRDPLINCYNRRYLMEYLGDEIRTHAENDLPMCVLMLDLDHFKVINDTYGHTVGDEILKLTAETIRHNLRQHDVLARYGGEEFTAVLPTCERENGIMIAERIRKSIEGIVYRRDIRFTISIGVAVLKQGSSPESILADSDQNLYIAKHNGRNLVVA